MPSHPSPRHLLPPHSVVAGSTHPAAPCLCPHGDSYQVGILSTVCSHDPYSYRGASRGERVVVVIMALPLVAAGALAVPRTGLDGPWPSIGTPDRRGPDQGGYPTNQPTWGVYQGIHKMVRTLYSASSVLIHINIGSSVCAKPGKRAMRGSLRRTWAEASMKVRRGPHKYTWHPILASRS